MYERMLSKRQAPAIGDLAAHCGAAAATFTQLNDWLAETFGTERELDFPYGNSYGWCVAHRLKRKLICNVFPEAGAFTVMVRLSGVQYAAVYGELRTVTQALIDNKYPCGDGGWIHYRVTLPEDVEDIQKILSVKCGGTKKAVRT